MTKNMQLLLASMLKDKCWGYNATNCALHNTFPWQWRLLYSKRSWHWPCEGINGKFQNYKSCQIIPILINGKSKALLILSNFATILIRIEEFLNKKHEIFDTKIDLLELQNSTQKILLVLMTQFRKYQRKPYDSELF